VGRLYGGEPAETVGAGELGLGDGDVEDALGLGDELGLGDTVGLGLRGADGSALGDGGAEEAVPSSGPGEDGAGARSLGAAVRRAGPAGAEAGC
jgi:hypothetical protein